MCILILIQIVRKVNRFRISCLKNKSEFLSPHGACECLSGSGMMMSVQLEKRTYKGIHKGFVMGYMSIRD